MIISNYCSFVINIHTRDRYRTSIRCGRCEVVQQTEDSFLCSLFLLQFGRFEFPLSFSLEGSPTVHALVPGRLHTYVSK